MKIVGQKTKLSLAEIEETLLTEHRYSTIQVSEIMKKLKEIDEIRKKKNAVILAHYYQIPPIQLIADIKGDSLKLAQAASEIKDKDLIVCSTVKFMAEMVKLLSPDKKVIIPSMEAGCSIAQGINGDVVKAIRKKFPSAAIISYINVYADTKAEVDSVCTSANAEEIVERIKGDPVILLPDYYFAKNIFKRVLDKKDDARKYYAYKEIRDKNIILEDKDEKEIIISAEDIKLPELKRGICVIHEQFTDFEIEYFKTRHNIDVVMAHPEVTPEVAKVADMLGGTGKMIAYAQKYPDKKYLIITECDLTTPLREACPDTEFFTPCRLCPYMKKNDLDILLNSLKDEVHEIELDDSTSEKAKASLQKMFELGK